MNGSRWTAIQTEMVRHCYRPLGPIACGELLGRTPAAVQKRASDIGATTPFPPKLPRATYFSVLEEECAKWFTPIARVTSRSLRRIDAFPRFTAWTRLHDKMGYSLPQIAKWAERDHSAILSGIKRARAGLRLPATKKIRPPGEADVHLSTFSGAQLRGG